MKLLKIFIPFLVIVFLPGKLFCQEVDKGFEVLEIFKISEAYRSYVNLSYDMQYTYADSARPNTILEQLQGKSKIRSGKYWTMIDSTEYVQGNIYSLTIFHNDSLIVIDNPVQDGNILRVPVIDSAFRTANVTDMTVTRLDDSTRSLVVTFMNGSLYKSYEIQYDLTSYQLRKMKYYVMDPVNADNPDGSGTGCVTILFFNYSEQPFDEDCFREGKFIYKQDNQFNVQQAFNGYHVLVNTSN